MEKPAQSDYPIDPLIQKRFSPRAFGDQAVSATQVASLLEAARWAASCFNEQPWRYIVAMRDDRAGFQALLSCVMEGNRAWAGQASVLMLSVAGTVFARNGKPNRHAWHDVGQASAQMAIQATAMGLRMHQMAGFDSDKAREVYGIPDNWAPVAALAIGFPGDPEALPETLRERELAPRTRIPMREIAFAGTWQQPFSAPTDP